MHCGQWCMAPVILQYAYACCGITKLSGYLYYNINIHEDCMGFRVLAVSLIYMAAVVQYLIVSHVANMTTCN